MSEETTDADHPEHHPDRHHVNPAVRTGVIAILGVIAIIAVALGFMVAVESDDGSAPVQKVTWTTTLTSQERKLTKVGPGDAQTYGWNYFTGQTTSGGQSGNVELLGSVDYTQGSGPWWGFFTITTPDGTLGLQVTKGQATLDAAADETAFTGQLEVIGGTGRYVDAGGTATAKGTRRGALGGAVEFNVDMALTGVAP